MNASRRYAIVAVAAVLMLLALGVAIGLQTPGSNSSPSISTTALTSSLGTATASSSSSAGSATSSSATSISAIVSSTSSVSSSTFSSSSQNGAEIMIPYDVGGNESLNFQPASITVVIGVNNTVTWIDLDSIQHTVVSTSIPAGAQKFDSGILNQGQTFSLTFTVPGTYHYDCSIHPDWMKGTILVLTSPPKGAPAAGLAWLT